MAFSNSSFLAFTSVNASATSSGVTLGFAINPSAFATAASAACLAAVYAAAVEVVLPSVAFSTFANSFNASLAVAKSLVFALSFSSALAFANSTFNLSTFAIADVASACVALFCSAFLTKSAAVAFASVKSVWIASTAFLYAAILAGVFAVSNVLADAGVNDTSAFRNSDTWSSVALSTNTALAASSFANTPSTAACAFNASCSLALSPASLIAVALFFAASNSVASWAYFSL